MSNTTNKNAGNQLRWVILGVLGVLLIVNRRFALNIAYAIFAIGLMLAGILNAYGWWEARKAQHNDPIDLLSGIVLFVVGLWILRNPSSFDRIINMIIGIVLLVSGAKWLIVNKQTNNDKTMSVLSIIAIAAGLVIAMSRAATGWLATACGFCLIYNAVTGYISEKIFRG
ncbi:MAG: DUF308 domain-containing protein [Clostridia bacterium]|nr:DUF308 domain-containing protein [Clostridia bacterium]